MSKNFFLCLRTRLGVTAKAQTREGERNYIEKNFYSKSRSNENKVKLFSLFYDYLALTKPGILTASLFTTLAGYLLAFPKGAPFSGKDLSTLLHTLFGTALVAMGAGSLNMLLEKEIDSTMNRTKNRPLPQGRVSPGEVFFLGSFCASLGIVHLCTINLATGFLASLSLALYLVFYTPLKEKTFFSIFVGAVSGAIPPLIGWTAKSGVPTLAGGSLFLILFVWQFPHFLSLSWIYREDYKHAHLKVILEQDESGKRTGQFALLGSLILGMVGLLPALFNLGGNFYLLSSLTLSALLIYKSYRFFKVRSESLARQLFYTTIAYIPILFVLLVLL